MTGCVTLTHPGNVCSVIHMNKTAGRAATIIAIAIASLSLTACGDTSADCEKPAAASTTVAATTASYVPDRFHPRLPRVPAIGHSTSTTACTNS